jgi:hypothetical protein
MLCLYIHIRVLIHVIVSDLFRKNIINSPRCTCCAIETPTHYLLNCPHYNIPRQRHIFALTIGDELCRKVKGLWIVNYGINRLLLKMNFCTDKKISVFWLIVNPLDPTKRSSVDKGIGRLRANMLSVQKFILSNKRFIP